MRIAFRGGASVDEVRAYFAALIGPAAGPWQEIGRTPLEHEGLGPDPQLARTHWRLGEATLEQTVQGGSGNPRDGWGYDLVMKATLPGGRRISVDGGAYEPRFPSLAFVLNGFSAAQFENARAAGRARFTDDDTSHPVWARENAQELAALGARDLACELIREALRRKAPDFARAAQRDLRRQLIGLTDDPAARAALEAEALRQDPTDVEGLAAVASGTKVLPGWQPEVAAQILARVRPWRKESEAHLAPESRKWAGPAGADWFWVNQQAFEVKVIDGARTRVPKGPLLPAPFAHVVELVRAALAIEGLGLSPHAVPAGRDEDCDGVVVGGAQVRAMAYRRDAALEWMWLWTGEGLRGAVVVSTRSAPVETRLCWLGDRPPAVERLVLTPC